MRKKIAFIRPKAWPLANVKVADALKEQTCDYDIEIIDIEKLVKTKILIMIINTIIVSLMYGRDIAAGYKKFREAFWRTPYIFNQVGILLKKRLCKEDYLYTFQMQSLFDCSLPNLAHFIYTDHTHLANLSYEGYDHKRLYPKQWTDLEKQVYDKAAKIFVRSTNIRKSVIEQYQQPADKVICVYAGNNVETNSSIRDDKSYAEQNILFVGIDWERKGGPELIEAYKQVLEKYPQATLTIAGAAPDLNMNNCKIIGKVSPSELIPYYQAASLFCMPTKAEPFGIAFLEAMQAGLPIIGTNIGAIPDFLQNNWNGFLVEPGDIQGIADGIIKLLDDPNLSRLYGNRNINLIRERYSWQAVCLNMVKHITENL